MRKRKATGIGFLILGAVLLVLGAIPLDSAWNDIAEIPMMVGGVVSIGIGSFKIFAPRGVRDAPPGGRS